MKKSTHVRINITLPEETITLLDSIAGKGTRSTFIDEAIRKEIHQLKKNSLRDRLKAGAIDRGTRDIAIAAEWSELEDNLWQG
jgi:CopG family transcriptional regulator / antitoxin EndoAI